MTRVGIPCKTRVRALFVSGTGDGVCYGWDSPYEEVGTPSVKRVKACFVTRIRDLCFRTLRAL